MHHRTKLVGASLSVALVMVAACAVSAFGSGGIKALKLEVAGNSLPIGAPILATSTNTEVSNAFWTLSCSEGALSGTLAQNLKAKNDYIPISEGSFAGGGAGGLCASPFEFVTTWIPSQPAELLLDRKGQALLRFARFKMVPKPLVEAPPGHHEACVASSNAAKGTFPLSETAQPLTVTFTNVKMHLESPHGEECGHGKGHPPKMSATFTFTSEGSEVDAVIFEHG